LEVMQVKNYKIWIHAVVSEKEFKKFKQYLSKLRINSVKRYLSIKVKKDDIVTLETDIDTSGKNTDTSRVEIYLKEIIDYSEDD